MAATRSGCSTASALTMLPPIECPTATTCAMLEVVEQRRRDRRRTGRSCSRRPGRSRRRGPAGRPRSTRWSGDEVRELPAPVVRVGGVAVDEQQGHVARAVVGEEQADVVELQERHRTSARARSRCSRRRRSRRSAGGTRGCRRGSRGSMRGFPGTLAPLYQELHDGSSTMLPSTSDAAWSAHSILRRRQRLDACGGRGRGRWARQSPIHSTCCSSAATKFVDGRRAARALDREQVREPGDLEARGTTAAPRRSTRPAGSTPSRPRMSMRLSAPVIASNPVAYRITSSSKAPCSVSMPVGVTARDRRPCGGRRA